MRPPLRVAAVVWVAGESPCFAATLGVWNARPRGDEIHSVPNGREITEASRPVSDARRRWAAE